MTQSPDPEVGSLAEETAKLWGALAGWAREQDLAGAFRHQEEPTPAGESGESGADESDAAAPGATCAGAPCRWCPVCRVAHAVAQVPPEVTVHLASAFASLARAAEAFVRTDPPGATPRSGDGDSTRVERIDLEDWDDPHAGG